MIDAPDEQPSVIDELRELRLRVARLEAEVADYRSQCSRHNEEELRRIADAAPVMLRLTGPDAACSYFNKLWLTFRGRTLKQELESGWTEGVHPQDVDRCLKTYLTSFPAEQEFQMEYRLRRADGEYRWMMESGVPRFSTGGVFEGYIHCGVDIHDRRAAQNSTCVPLTEREKQVMVLIAEGKSTKEAAAMLGISYKTADSHRSKIMEKLDVHETASLVRYAIRHNLVKA
ncbi:MAG TPA: LuxR C-terminal-related transcriptional regulator [Bryobacteraceae bacterium]|nr:LuxR C-terminal-related transcriptional regulator [Bryobacteraceae bacterium]